MARRRAAAGGRKSRTPTGKRIAGPARSAGTPPRSWGDGGALSGKGVTALQYHPLRRLHVRDAAQLVEERVVDVGVDLPEHERALARRAPAPDVQARDVDAAVSELRADGTDDAGAVDVAHEEQAALGRGVEDEVVDLHDARLGLVADLEQRPGHGAHTRGGAGAELDGGRERAAPGTLDLDDAQPALL